MTDRSEATLRPLRSAELQWTMPESVPVQITKSVQGGPGPITEFYRQNAKRQIAEMMMAAQAATRERLNAAQVPHGKEAVINVQPLHLQFNGMGPGGEFQLTVYNGLSPHTLPAWQGRFEVHAKPEDPPRAMGSRLADAVLATLQQAGLLMAPTAAGRQPLKAGAVTAASEAPPPAAAEDATP